MSKCLVWPTKKLRFIAVMLTGSESRVAVVWSAKVVVLLQLKGKGGDREKELHLGVVWR